MSGVGYAREMFGICMVTVHRSPFSGGITRANGSFVPPGLVWG
jgi:hypothetical protein